MIYGFSGIPQFAERLVRTSYQLAKSLEVFTYAQYPPSIQAKSSTIDYAWRIVRTVCKAGCRPDAKAPYQADSEIFQSSLSVLPASGATDILASLTGEHRCLVEVPFIGLRTNQHGYVSQAGVSHLDRLIGYALIEVSEIIDSICSIVESAT